MNRWIIFLIVFKQYLLSGWWEFFVLFQEEPFWCYFRYPTVIFFLLEPESNIILLNFAKGCSGIGKLQYLDLVLASVFLYHLSSFSSGLTSYQL